MIRGNVIPAGVNTALTRSDRSIGAILVDNGRLKPEDAESILRLQSENGMRFGDAALQLGLVTKDDIEFAIARQFDYPHLVPGQSTVSQHVVAAYSPFSQQVEALRALRSQLMLRWFNADASHKALAIVSAERKDGRSFMTANLAVVFSQLGLRTLIVDADMRNPSQHELFGLDNREGLSAVLTGRVGPDPIRQIPGLRNLYVLSAGVPPPNPSDLLARPEFTRLMKELVKEFNVVIVDTPAGAENADAQAVALCAGGAMIVVRKNASRLWLVRGIAENAVQTSATIVGTVFNDV